MQAVGYFLLLPFIYLVALLPFPLLYGLSDVLFVLLYYAVRYRKKVVLDNLRNAFPEKREEEIQKISRRYYRYLCDLMLETFKTLVISKTAAARRCKITPDAQQLFDEYYRTQKRILIVMGHYGNWEWGGNTFSLLCKQQLYVIYHPLSNKYFDGLMYRMRTRFGTKLIAMKDTFKEIIKNRNEINATAFIADQTPPPENAYWTTFLNQETPVFPGIEKVARKMNYPVVYVYLTREVRGGYRLFAKTLTDKPADTAEGVISETFTRQLEKDIRQQPEIWLWSHRRWKHRRPAPQ